jgi:hypothetical protein
MGDIIDLERQDDIYRCKHVKLWIIWINLIGPPISLIFLLFGIIRMIFIKKRKTFLATLILLIFLSEIIQCISKLIQLLKYDFTNKRNDKSFDDPDTPRGIICQIQIVLAVFSDFCSLLSTLLLSLRCYDVIKNRRRFFDKGKNGILSILIFLCLSLAFSISFLFIDRERTSGNLSYRYDIRDRCSYWCWLDHYTSLACLGCYYIILGFNIYFACKTNCYLKKGYKKLLEENQLLPGKVNKIDGALNEENSDNSPREKRETFLTNEEKKRIEELRIMRVKCLIYPTVTIAYWLFAATYRIVDDTVMQNYDEGHDPYKKEREERELFEDHPIFQGIVEFFFVVYTFLSSIRGILYGLSFIVFEEKIFFNFFRKFMRKFFKDEDLEINSEEEKELVGNTNSTSLAEVEISNIKENNRETTQKTIELNANSYCEEKENE